MLLYSLQTEFCLGNSLLELTNEVNCFGVFDSFFALMTPGEIALQRRVHAIQVKWKMES